MKNICFVLHLDFFIPWPLDRAAKEMEVLRENGAQITVVSWIKEPLDLPAAEVRDGIRVHRYFLQPPKTSFLKRALAYLKMSKEISRIIREIRPDAVVCHDLEMLHPSVKAVKALKVPLFYDSHENWPAMVAPNSKFESKRLAALEKRLLRQVIYSYTYGNDLTEKFRNMGFPVTTLYNSKYLDNVPSTSEEDIAEIRRQFGFKESDFILGFAGSSKLENGLQQTIDALAKLPEDIKFFIVGGSRRKGDVEEIEKYITIKKLDDRIILTGRVKSDTLMIYTSTFDVGTALFQPFSQNEIARVPNKIFDYMALSIPMIVSDFPNMRKVVVKESDCGLAVNPRNIDDIAKAVRYFYEYPDDKKQKGRKGREMFERVYCWDIQKKKLLDSHPIWRGED